MSDYFSKFNRIDYIFGDDYFSKGGGDSVLELMQNLTSYVEVIDSIKQNSSFYSKYEILEGDRPDQVSQKLYGTPEYHWTFFLMNDKIREGRWPTSPNDVFDRAVLTYGTRVITTRTKLTDKYKIGQTITGASSGATAKIGARILDLGQLFLEDVVGTFVAGENVNSVNANGVTEVITVTSFEFQYNAAHHYENSDKEYVDIDPEVGPGAQLTEVTWLDRVQKINTDNREIKVIKPGVVNEIVKSFRDAVSSA